MKFSVIVPVYNVAPYLSKFLESLLNQDYKDYEIILVNDGSVDESLAICQKYAVHYPYIVVLSQENQGSGYARNTGLKAAKGDYVYFCDPDDYLNEGFFNHAEKYLLWQPDLVIFSFYDVRMKKDKVAVKQLVEIEEDIRLDKKTFRNVFISLFDKNILFTLWNKLYRREFLSVNNIQFTDVSMGQDTRFNLELYPLVSSVQLVKESFYNYISNRLESSTEKFRPNRAQLQLEEATLLEKTLKQLNLKENVLLEKMYLNILLGNSNHIANSHISMKEKRVALNKLVEMDIFKERLDGKMYSTNVSLKLLQNKQLDLYLLMKRVQRTIKKV